MIRSSSLFLACALATALPPAAAAQTASGQRATPVSAAAPAAKPNSPLAGFGSSNSKDPYKIDANRLEVSQKDNKAVYLGDVVVIQGKITMRCSQLNIFFEQKKEERPAARAGGAGQANRAQPAASAQPGATGLRRLECLGPVSVVQEKQTATSNLLVYESEIVTLTGNVIVSDGDNVQAGEKLVYNTKTSVGTMEAGGGGRVRGIFIPGSGGDADPSKKADRKPKTN